MRACPTVWVTTQLSRDYVMSVNDKANVYTHMFGAYSTWWKALVLMWTCLGLMVGNLGPDVDMFGTYGWKPWS